MKIHSYHDFCETVSQEDSILLIGYITQDAQKLDIRYWKEKMGDVFNVRHLIFVSHVSDCGVRHLEIEVLYNYQNGFMKVEVVQVAEYKNKEELDLLFTVQNLISEHALQSN